MDRQQQNERTISFVSLLVLALLGAVLSTSACSKRYHNLPAFSAIPVGDAENGSVGRFKTTYLADQIHAYFRGSTRAPLAVATFVSIDDLYASSTFGRILSEQLISELSMRGYSVLEIRQSDALQVHFDEGELALSRDTALLKNGQEVSGLVVGTYAVSPIRVYLNARIIDPVTSLIVSVGSVEMAKTDEIDRLLRSNSIPQSLERIPVRQLGYAGHQYPAYLPWQWPNSYYYPGTRHAQDFDWRFEEPEVPALEENHNKKGKDTVPQPKLESTT